MNPTTALRDALFEIENLQKKLAAGEPEGWEGSRRRLALKERIKEALASPPVASVPEPIIDLDAVMWSNIQKAASESNWIPDAYMMNDWVADVCKFLRGTPPPEPRDERAEFEKWWKVAHRELMVCTHAYTAFKAWQARAGGAV